MISLHLEAHYVYKTLGKIDYKRLLHDQETVYQAIVYYDKRYKSSFKNFLKFLNEVGYCTKALNSFNMAGDIISTKADNLLLAAYNMNDFLPLVKTPFILLDENYPLARPMPDVPEQQIQTG